MGRWLGIEQAARPAAKRATRSRFATIGRRSPADRRARGQALTEFALLAPAFLLLMLLAVDFGRLFFSYIAVNNAVREATYYAADHAADSDFDQDEFNVAIAQAAVLEANSQAQGGEGNLTVVGTPRCFNPLTGDAVSTPPPISCTVASGFAPGIGNHVSVSVEQPFTFITPLIGDIFGGQLMLRTSATAPVLNPLDASILPGPSMPPAATPTPTPSPTPTPLPTPTPTLPPGATPSPTPAPTPTPTPTPVPTCTVPDYKKGFWNNTGGLPALTVWANAGFTGTLTNLAGSNEIKTQTIHKGNTVPCTSSMSVDD